LVPNGLSLPELFGAPQLQTQFLGTLDPMTQKQAQWVVRGDRAGKYKLTGHATGNLQLGGGTVPLEAKLKSDEIEVVQPRIKVTFDTPSGTVRKGDTFTTRVNLTNLSTINLSAVSVNIHGDRLANCKLVGAGSVDLGSVLINQTKTASFQFQSLVTGTVRQ